MHELFWVVTLAKHLYSACNHVQGSLLSLLDPLPGASLIAQLLKNLPLMKETLVPSLGWEDPLEKGMATHSSILA